MDCSSRFQLCIEFDGKVQNKTVEVGKQQAACDCFYESTVKEISMDRTDRKHTAELNNLLQLFCLRYVYEVTAARTNGKKQQRLDTA